MKLQKGAPIELLERDEQLRQLGQAFALASAGHGRIVAIAAEAGAGKTALIEALRNRARHPSPVVREHVRWALAQHRSIPVDEPHP